MSVKLTRDDKSGDTLTVPADTSTKHGQRSFPEVELWFGNRGRADNLIIRQENGEKNADVLDLSLSQVYDLTAALLYAIGMLPEEKLKELK